MARQKAQARKPKQKGPSVQKPIQKEEKQERELQFRDDRRPPQQRKRSRPKKAMRGAQRRAAGSKGPLDLGQIYCPACWA